MIIADFSLFFDTLFLVVVILIVLKIDFIIITQFLLPRLTTLFLVDPEKLNIFKDE